MINMSIIKMSSKGQIVIPSNMRSNIKEGEELIIIKDNERFILKKTDSLTESMKEDLEFAKRTEEAYREIEAGKSIRVKLEDLDKVMDSW